MSDKFKDYRVLGEVKSIQLNGLHLLIYRLSLADFESGSVAVHVEEPQYTNFDQAGGILTIGRVQASDLNCCNGIINTGTITGNVTNIVNGRSANISTLQPTIFVPQDFDESIIIVDEISSYQLKNDGWFRLQSYSASITTSKL
jgi:hypothetical protein